MKKFLQDILKEADQNNEYRYSWARLQSFISFFYFLVLYTKQTWGNNTIPDIPDGWIFLIGVSSATYLVAKYTNNKVSGFNYSNNSVYNPPHASVNNLNDSVIIPGPDGPSALSVKKNDND